MDNIDSVMVESLQNANFVKPYRLTYSQNNIQKTWEVISVHPSVSILIFNTDRKKLVLVRQFRPAVYFSNFPRSERELSSTTTLSAGTHSAATQSAAAQSTQHTQTAPRSVSTQETQTTHARQHSEVPCGRPKSSQSTQATQSTEVIKTNQCVQSDVCQSISTSTQSPSLQCCQQSDPASSYSDVPHGASTGRKTLPSQPGAGGLTLELCAGIVDKDVPLREIAREEVLEECGYNVSAEALEQVITYRSGVGASGDRQTLFFVEVTDAMKVGEGGGLAAEGELIEVVELGVPEVRALLQQEEVLAPGGFLFALMWFLANKADKYQ